MTEQELVTEIDIAVQGSGGISSLARLWKISPSYLSDILNKRRRAGKKVLKEMGLKRITTVQTEIVDDR